MARQSQGCLIRRESSVAGTTAVLSADTISFDSTLRTINRQAGFADFSTGMRLEVNASLNAGVWTIKTTAATAITVYEALTAQSSGETVSITGHTMQNIGQVVSFNGPGLSGPVIDVTTLQSTAKEKQPGLSDGGQFGLSLLWDNEASAANLHDALVRDMVARTKRKFDVVFVGPTTAQTGAVYFGGCIVGFNITGAVDNVLKADVSIALSSGANFIVNAAT
jgi:hypothetical protein